jgi:hypothetical protein
MCSNLQGAESKLNFLAMGYKTYKSIKMSDAKHKNIFCLFILFQFPTIEGEWIHVGNEFEHFPNCLGAVNSKHVKITPPTESGSLYWNYNGFNCLVLMSITNANYEFLSFDIGNNGRVLDGGVTENTKFYKKLLHEELCYHSYANLMRKEKYLGKTGLSAK